MLQLKYMNNIDDMWPICHDCPYWEVCEPPYICGITREKQTDNHGEDCDQIEYETAVEMQEYCEMYEPTYNPEDGSM